jgi:hypothetical protein
LSSLRDQINAFGFFLTAEEIISSGHDRRQAVRRLFSPGPG